jgi:hypothetical protein
MKTKLKKAAIKTGLVLIYIATLFSQCYQLLMWCRQIDGEKEGKHGSV